SRQGCRPGCGSSDTRGRKRCRPVRRCQPPGPRGSLPGQTPRWPPRECAPGGGRCPCFGARAAVCGGSRCSPGCTLGCQCVDCGGFVANLGQQLASVLRVPGGE